jgi:2-phosphosulfolactate phosphatase
MPPDWATQHGFDVRFDWGPAAIEALGGDVVVVVDVLRFTTAVDAAVSRDALVYPYRWRDASAGRFATDVGAELADSAGDAGLSLSPRSLLGLEPGAKIVLPSPNGSTCAVIASEAGMTVVAACLRNAGAVAAWLNNCPGPVTIIACGERWPDGSLRPCLEDYLGAGAVIAALAGDRSPEARAAAASWRDAEPDIAAILRSCASGRELQEYGWGADLADAGDVNVSRSVPVLGGGAFADAGSRHHRA